MFKSKTKKAKKVEPKKVAVKKEVVVNPWDHLGVPTTHPDHKGKDIYVKGGSYGYFLDGVFIKV
jgi:hypothetical protein